MLLLVQALILAADSLVKLAVPLPLIKEAPVMAEARDVVS